MKEILLSIKALDNVHGAFVTHASGQLIAREMPAVFDDSMLKNVGEVAGRCVAGLQTTDTVDELDLVFDNALLVVRNLGDATLFTLCDSEINTSFLNLTAKVAADRIKERLTDKPPEAAAARSQRDRLRKVLTEELGAGSPKALEILGAAGDSPEEFDHAIDEIERMVRLFIDKDKAGRLAGRLRGMLAD